MRLTDEVRQLLEAVKMAETPELRNLLLGFVGQKLDAIDAIERPQKTKHYNLSRDATPELLGRSLHGKVVMKMREHLKSGATFYEKDIKGMPGVMDVLTEGGPAPKTSNHLIKKMMRDGHVVRLRKDRFGYIYKLNEAEVVEFPAAESQA